MQPSPLTHPRPSVAHEPFQKGLKQAFGDATEGIYLRARLDGKLFNISTLNANSKVQTKYLRNRLLADDAAVTAHSAGTFHGS